MSAEPDGFFQITARDPDSRARTGILQTRHGTVATPAFMPVGTRGSVKALEPRDLEQLGFRLILANAYHLFLRPGHRTVARLGGLHRFMGWDGALLTDSGGFQVFSLSERCRIDEDGVEFASHLDGTRHRFDPELCMEIQAGLGADLVMPLDDCPPYPADRQRIVDSVNRTTRWARRSLRAELSEGQHRFGIIQGGVNSDLRLQSAEEITGLGFAGYALGGLGVGEPPPEALAVTSTLAPRLPDRSPRYVMGIGRPDQLLDLVAEGIDLFDCVVPTRNARNGTLFTSRGRLNIKRREFLEDADPVDPDCPCATCGHFSRAYLRHLYKSREILSARLNTLHNLAYFAGLMRRAGEAIRTGDYRHFRAREEFTAPSPSWGRSDAHD